MSKIVTLSEEEVEILLSHHKQKLADLAKELKALTEKQRFSEARLHDLTDQPGGDETSGHSEMETVHAEHGETTREEDLVFAPEAIHDEASETSGETEATHEPEAEEVHAEGEETAAGEEHTHEPAVEGYLEKAKTFLEEKLHVSDLLNPERGETPHTQEPAY
jgi:hypothetical protein